MKVLTKDEVCELPKKVIAAQQDFFFFFKIFAIRSYSVEDTTKTTVTFTHSFYLEIYGYVLVLILITMTVVGAYNEITSTTSLRIRTPIDRVMITVNFIMSVGTFAVNVLSSLKWHRCVLAVLQKVEKTDQILKYTGYTEEKTHNWRLFIFIVSYVFGMIYEYFFFFSHQTPTRTFQYFNYLSGSMASFIIMISMFEYILIVRMLSFRIKRLNEVLRINFERDPDEITKIKCVTPDSGPQVLTIAEGSKLMAHRLSFLSRFLEELIRCYGYLNEAVYEVNKRYGLFVLVYLLGTMYHLIESPFYLVKYMLQPDSLSLVLFYAMWTAFHLQRIFLLVEPCSGYEMEVVNTKMLISRLLINETNPTLLCQLKMFSLQTLQLRQRFSAHGFCEIRRPLLSTVFGAVTTYLVILYQFDKSDQH